MASLILRASAGLRTLDDEPRGGLIVETAQQTAAAATIRIRLGDTDVNDVRVIELTGREGLNELFEYTVQLSSTGIEIDLETVLKSSCTIEIAAAEGTR